MAVKRVPAKMDVVTAARMRLKNVFSNKLPVYYSFSGGKDSLVIADIILRMIRAGEIDPKLLTVIFIDEEAMYGSVIEIVEDWRKRFILAGATFFWYCIEVKHFSAYNQLTSDESYTCWDSTKSDIWVRQPPPFAIRNHPSLRPGVDNYQSFLPKVTKDGIMLVGVRASESVQRLQYMAQLNLGTKGSMTNKNFIYPIYDWSSNDVWLYLKEHNVDIPIVYMWMYQVGVSKNALRISQLFSVDCIGSIIHVSKFEPGLWERVLRREPNAYLALLYWDTELYRRSSGQRRKQEDQKDFKALVMKMLFEEPDKHFTTPLTKTVADQYRKAFIRHDGIARQRDYRKMYDALIAGDPKLRTLRAVNMDIYSAYADYAKKFRKNKLKGESVDV